MRCVADAVVVAVEALVVIPEIAVPNVGLGCTCGADGDAGQVVLETVVEKAMTAVRAVEEGADDVVREAVVPDRQRASRLWRSIDLEADGAVQHLVVFDQRLVAFLEHDAAASGRQRMGDVVPAQDQVGRVKHDDAGAGVRQAVVLDPQARREDDVHAVTAVGEGGVADPVVRRVGEGQVAGALEAVAIDDVVAAVP